MCPQNKEDLSPYIEKYQSTVMSDEGIDKMKAKIDQAKRANSISRRNLSRIRWTAAVAACLTVLILPNTSSKVAYAMEQIPVIGGLVSVITFRDYKYDSDRNNADIEVPNVVVDDELVSADNADTIKKTTEEINTEIEEITDELIKEFETYAEDELGYQDVMVKSEVLKTTPDYFTLKLICYEGAGSGYEWNYFYTIDLKTGKRLALKDIFVDGADYITPISENIKTQMQEQMDADENVHYWLNDEFEEWNFKSITDETSFYLDEKGNLVICFNEGDVAPMYMGTVSFTIPSNVIKDIRK